MTRKVAPLAKMISTAQPAGSTSFEPTDGYLNSVEAVLADGSTSATVAIFVSNSSRGRGVLIATLNLSAASPSDGFTLPREDSAWHFVRAEVTAVVGTVASVTASVGE